MWKKYQQIPMVAKMITGMVLGALAGWYMGPGTAVFQPLGRFFLTCLKCIAMPLIIVNLLAGIANLDNPESFGRIGGRILLYYVLTSALALCVGIAAAGIIKPGAGLVLEGKYEGVVASLPSVGATLLSLVPDNAFKALTEGRLDQVVVVTAFTGIGLLLLPAESRKRLGTLFQDLSDMTSRLVFIVMILAPFGIFAFVAVSMGKYGSSIFGSLAEFIVCIYASVFTMCCVYALLVYVSARITPREFFRKALPMMLTAFSTTSSTSSIPVNMECAEKLGVPQKAYSFTIPLGAQVNKDGTCVCLTSIFIMTAQAIGVDVNFGMMMKAIVISLILTTGSGAIPGGMLMIIPILLQSLGFPLEIVGLVAGVYPFCDMGMTMINCLGDLAGTVLVGSGEKKRDAQPGTEAVLH